jgi:hypothetical protein
LSLFATKNVEIKCDKHSDRVVEYECFDDKKLVCAKCAFEEHSDHKSAVKDISDVQVGEYLELMNVKI